MTRTLVLFIIFFYPIFGESQAIRPSILKLADKISRVNELEQFTNLNRKDNVFEYFRLLCQEATHSELLYLTSDTNPVVRCYAFRGLTERPNSNLIDIIIGHLKDTTIFTMWIGDRGMKKYVGDYFIEIAKIPIINDGIRLYGDNLLNKEQKNKLDSALIFEDNIKLQARQSLLTWIKPNPNYYSRIRQIATQENDPRATIALARYKNKNDIEIIKKLFKSEETEYYAVYSAREFPDNSFYPFLIKIFENEWENDHYTLNNKLRVLYQALAKYPEEDDTYQLFKKTTEIKDGFRYQTLCTYLTLAITKYPCNLFDLLKNKIKLDSYSKDNVKRLMKYNDEP